MITLHQFARVWGIPNLSPFCCKVEMVLRVGGVAYHVADAVPPQGPKGKLPYITTEDGEKIGDSRFILAYLRERHGVDPDGALEATQRAQSTAFQRLIEDDLFWAMMHSRWIQPDGWRENKQAIFSVLPPVVRDAVGVYARRKVRGQIRGQGLGLHTEDEVYDLGRQDLDALADFLSDRRFFFGDAPATLDASAFGLLSCVLWPPIESPLRTHAESLPNLVRFCEDVRDTWFKDVR